MTWSCTKIQQYRKEIACLLTLMLEQQLHLTPLLALLGYVKPLAKKIRRFTVMTLLLAKRQISLNWGKPTPPTVNEWLRDLQYCNVASDDYALLLPIASKPRDIWHPLRDYIRQFPLETNDWTRRWKSQLNTKVKCRLIYGFALSMRPLHDKTATDSNIECWYTEKRWQWSVMVCKYTDTFVHYKLYRPQMEYIFVLYGQTEIWYDVYCSDM